MSFPIAVFISGAGTTLQNLIDRIRDGSLPARIVLVVSSRPDTAGVERARAAGLPVQIVERKRFPSIESFSEHNFNLCRQSGARLICLGGYLQLLRIPDDYRGRVINIHPAFLPAFGGKGMYGRHVHEAVLKLRCQVDRLYGSFRGRSVRSRTDYRTAKRGRSRGRHGGNIGESRLPSRV